MITLYGLRDNLVTSDYQVTPSDDVSYFIEESALGIIFDETEVSGTGGRFEGLRVNKGTTFDVEVLSINEEFGVSFEVDNSTDTVTSTINNDEFLLEFINFLYYPYHECDRLLNFEYDFDMVAFGPEILDWFFLDVNSNLWDFITELTTDAYHEALPFYDQFNVLIQSAFEFQGNLAFFDFYMNGEFENETEGTSVRFGHALKFIWDNTTGILQGYRVSTETIGSYQNHQVGITLEVVIRESSYDLPDFKFYPGLFPGFNYLTAFAVLLVIFLGQLFFKKAKRKRRIRN
jgi:hypothetical protein